MEGRHEGYSEECATHMSITTDSRTPRDMHYRSLFDQSPQTGRAVITNVTTSDAVGATSYKPKKEELEAFSGNYENRSITEAFNEIIIAYNPDRQWSPQTSEDDNPKSIEATKGVSLGPLIYASEIEQPQTMSNYRQMETSNKYTQETITPHELISKTIPISLVPPQNRHLVLTKTNILASDASDKTTNEDPSERQIDAKLLCGARDRCYMEGDNVPTNSSISSSVASGELYLREVEDGSFDLTPFNYPMNDDEFDPVYSSFQGQSAKEVEVDAKIETKVHANRQDTTLSRSFVMSSEQVKQVSKIRATEMINDQSSEQKQGNSGSHSMSLQQAWAPQGEPSFHDSEQESKFLATFGQSESISQEFLDQGNAKNESLQSTRGTPVPRAHVSTSQQGKFGPKGIIRSRKENQANPIERGVPPGFLGQVDIHRTQQAWPKKHGEKNLGLSMSQHSNTMVDDLKYKSQELQSLPGERLYKKKQCKSVVPGSSGKEVECSHNKAAKSSVPVINGGGRACVTQDFGLEILDDKKSEEGELNHRPLTKPLDTIIKVGTSENSQERRASQKVPLKSIVKQLPKNVSARTTQKKSANVSEQTLAKNKRPKKAITDSSESEGEPLAKRTQTQCMSHLKMYGRNVEMAIDLTAQPSMAKLKLNIDDMKKIAPKVAFHPHFQDGKVYIEFKTTKGSIYCYRFEKPFLQRLSNWFASSIELIIEEPNQDLANYITEKAPFDTRYELIYSQADEFWLLERTPLTKPNNKSAALLPNSSLNDKKPGKLSSSLISQETFTSCSSVKPIFNDVEGAIMASDSNILVEPRIKKGGGDDGKKTATTKVKIEEFMDYELNQHIEEMKKDPGATKCNDENDAFPDTPNHKSIEKSQEKRLDALNSIERTSTTKRAVSTEKYFPPTTNCGIPINVCEAYNNLFLIFHGMLPKLKSNDVEVALVDVELLAKAASSVGYFEFVKPHIYSYLYNFGQEMYISIFRDPPRWLKISCALKSGPIFRAAITHIVGQYPYWPWTPGSHDQLPDELYSIIKQKVDELSVVKSAIDSSLFVSTLADEDQRVSFFNLDRASFNAWFVITCWRDWYCHSFSQVNSARHDSKSNASMYRLMAQGGGAYLPLASVVEKLREFKGGNLAPADLEEAAHNLRIMKEYAAEQVKPLCVNRSMLDIDEHGIDYFTCIDIAESQLPWISKDNMDETQGLAVVHT